MTENDRALANPDYWDTHYSKSDGTAQTHEWFRSFTDLEPFLRQNLFEVQGVKPDDNPLILHLGSGDSVVPSEFASRGYRQQLCIDFSTIVVERMAEQHRNIEGIEWTYMDVRNMDSIEDRTVDVAFDKGTLDAMIHGSPWNPPDEVTECTSQYLKEVHRVLKDDGVFLYVTFRQPHFIKPLLNPDDLWSLDMQTLGESGFINYYGFVIKKKKF